MPPELKSRFARAAAAALLCALLLILGARIAHFAAQPDFKVAIIKYRKPDLLIRNLSLEYRLPRSVLTIAARSAWPVVQMSPRPGASAFFLALAHPLVTSVNAGDGPFWSAGAIKGRITATDLVLEQPLLIRGIEPPRPQGKIEVNLKTGREAFTPVREQKPRKEPWKVWP